jgi:HEAT repeat protein
MALGKLKVTSAIEPLTMLLRRNKNCDAAIKALWYIGTPKSQELALEAAKRNIKGQPIREAMRAAKTLATFAAEEEKAFDALNSLLEDDDIVVRCVGVETLSLLGHKALPQLQTALKDVDAKQDPATLEPSNDTYGKSYRDFVSSAILRLGAALETSEDAKQKGK